MNENQLARIITHYQQKLANADLTNAQLLIQAEDATAVAEALRTEVEALRADRPAPATDPGDTEQH